MNDLDRLAGLAGIEESYWDIFGEFHETGVEVKQSILSAMGFDCDRPEAVRRSLGEFEERPWRRLLEPVCVLRKTGGALPVTLTLPESHWSKTLRWRALLEDGTEAGGAFRCADGEFLEKRHIDGVKMARLNLQLHNTLPEGYHVLRIEGAGETAETTLIVAPPKSYAPAWLQRGKRLWGVACHIYSLRSVNNWGVGDFSDLAHLIRVSAGFGSAAVGVNPLHALFPVHAEHASPYSPSSRQFLNPLYIDVAAVPEFLESPEVQAMTRTQGFTERLAKARGADFVDYPCVAAIKLAALERMHDFFVERYPPGSSRRADFDAFLGNGGAALRRFTLFQALHENFEGRPWSEWPEGYRLPDSVASNNFARDNQRRLQFHAYLQWLAARQLEAAALECSDNGMAVGLYMDLAVGVDPNGADAWSDPGVIVHGARFGAPPDAFNIQGQDWGMPPLHPMKLRQKAYRPFIHMLRANMRCAGALRIDHVMGLMHLYWIPPGAKASGGAYVRYPFDDLLGIVALESARNKCLVIGEDLGTVPQGFRERMAAEGALSYRVLRFERYGEGLFKRPEAYPAQSLATSGTHDLSTIRGYWLGCDVKLRLLLGLYGDKKAENEDAKSCGRERQLLIAALRDQGLPPEAFPDENATEEETVRQLVVAIERFLARSPAQLLNVNLDDLLVEADQLNLPGAVTEYPNWRRKLSANLETLSADPFIGEVVRAIKSER